ncbi:MAG TPA: hypothetical protein P5048_04855 [Chlamydiales bacterium]|nr:hypothetical protein [Chlamydiales bacterium]
MTLASTLAQGAFYGAVPFTCAWGCVVSLNFDEFRFHFDKHCLKVILGPPVAVLAFSVGLAAIKYFFGIAAMIGVIAFDVGLVVKKFPDFSSINAMQFIAANLFVASGVVVAVLGIKNLMHPIFKR